MWSVYVYYIRWIGVELAYVSKNYRIERICRLGAKVILTISFRNSAGSLNKGHSVCGFAGSVSITCRDRGGILSKIVFSGSSG